MFMKNSAKPLLKKTFLKQANHIGYVITKLRRYVEVSVQASSNSFFQGIFLK